MAVGVLLDNQYISARRAEKQHSFGESESALFSFFDLSTLNSQCDRAYA